MKKILAAAAFVGLAVIVSAFPVFAGHHGGGHRNNAAKTYAVCPVENCVNAGLHTHDSQYYTAHHSADGHDYHEHVHYAGCGHNIGGHHGGGRHH